MMNKNKIQRISLLILFLFLLKMMSFCQVADTFIYKTPTPVEINTNIKKGKTRALVIGIAKYQQIKSLNYADKDALEFALFLKNNPSYKLTGDDLLLLVNENAKAGNILTALSQIIDSSKSGDQLIFYFSGHGDVETIADSSQGYLLTYDSPKNNYATGAISVGILQKAFGLLIEKGVNLLLITDACRSGQLAGGIQGAFQAAKAFSQQWKSQVKILSAQPDELSFESDKWGDGRGLFSFFLVKGLSGYADINHDSTITLSEIEQYAGLQIAQETQFKQQPIFEGPSKFSFKMSITDTAVMHRYEIWNSGSAIAVYVINADLRKSEKGKTISDSVTKCSVYNRLKDILSFSVIDSKQWRQIRILYDSVNTCDPQLIGKIKLTLSTAIMNDLQQTVNQSLIGQKIVGEEEINLAIDKIRWLFEINKDKELFYATHFVNIRRYLQVLKLHFIEGSNDKLRKYIADKNLLISIDSALIAEPEAAYLNFAKGVIYSKSNLDDSAIYYFTKTLNCCPTWLMPRLGLGHICKRIGRQDLAFKWFVSILNMDSVYKEFECAKCFYEELYDLYNDVKKNNHILFYSMREELEKLNPNIFRYPPDDLTNSTIGELEKLELEMKLNQLTEMDFGKRYEASKNYKNGDVELNYKKELELDPGNKRLKFELYRVYSFLANKSQMKNMLRQIDAGDSTILDKLETLELITKEKLLTKIEIEKRLENLYKLIKVDHKDIDRVGRSMYNYVKGLCEYYFNNGNPIKYFDWAFNETSDDKYRVKFAISLINAKIAFLKIYSYDSDTFEDLSVVIDRTIDELRYHISEDDMIRFNYYKMLYLLLTGELQENSFSELKNWVEKGKLNCDDLSYIKEIIFYKLKENPQYRYPKSIKEWMVKCK